MAALSDDEFDHVRDFDLSESESEAESADEHEHEHEHEQDHEQDHGTPSTTPPRQRTPRPSDRKTIPCPYKDCSKTFNRNARLQEHIRSHTGERPFKCPHAFCPKAFLRDTHLKHHVKSAHSNIRNYACTWDGCDKSFATGTRLRRHFQSHEGKERFRCRGYDGCNETFRKHETLRRHVLAVHENQKPFPCDYVHPDTGEACPKAFDTSDNLKCHQRAIHDTSRFSCPQCIAGYQKDSDVLMTTQDPSPFTFGTFSALQAHIAEAHPPACEHCQATFFTNKELRRHLELEHGIPDPQKQNAKRFPCTHPGCKNVFTKQGNLNVHVKTVHEKQKDFICGTTEVAVPSELDLQSVTELHGCGRSFTSKASLVEHIRTAHFDLPSKRAQREQKKQAKRNAEDNLSTLLPVKRRATRKDKGVKKLSTLTTLTGMNMDHFAPKLSSFSRSSFNNPSSQQPQSFDDLMNDSEDDWNQLSGSMTLLGDHLYHNGQGYQLVSSSEDGSADQSRLNPELDDGQYLPCDDSLYGANATAAHTEPFFDFEHEREHIHPNMAHDPNIDPMLQC